MVQHADKLAKSDCYKVQMQMLKCHRNLFLFTVFLQRMYVHLLFNLCVDFKVDI